jgi:hypothetical protein
MAIIFLISAISTAGVALLYQYCIRQGQVFDFMQKPLVWLQPRSEFWYKRLGGCPMCNTQLFSDVIYWILAVTLTNLAWYYLLFWWVMFSGMTLWFYFLVAYQMKKDEPTQTQFKTETEHVEL